MKHWVLGLEEEGADRELVAWLEAQPDPEEAVKTALRALAFPQPESVSPRVRRALAALRAAVADVEAAVGLTAEAEVAAAAAGTGEPPAAQPQPGGLPDSVVDSKIGKLLDFEEDRDADLSDLDMGSEGDDSMT